MENPFELPLALKKGILSEKNNTLLQIIIVISSGILSSSAITTALKAWLDNRKTTLTIQIDDDRRTLTYEGHHLNQDAPTIQIIMEKLSENTKVVIPVDAMTIDLTDDGEKEEAVLEVSHHQEITTLPASKRPGMFPNLLAATQRFRNTSCPIPKIL